MKAFRTIKNIGRIDLATLEVMDDSLSVAIELSMVSDSIKEQINTAIKETNKQYDEEMQIPWGNAEAVIDYMGLNITYEKGKTDYYIAITFHSAENELLWDNANIAVDLQAEDAAEFKKLIVKAVIDKFF